MANRATLSLIIRSRQRLLSDNEMKQMEAEADIDIELGHLPCNRLWDESGNMEN